MLITAYFAWMALVFAGKLSNNWETQDTSRLLTLGYFALFMLTLPVWRRLVARWKAPDGVRFVTLGLISAYIVETMFMISKPINPNLVVTADTPLQQAVINTLLDWAFVTPIYAIVYAVFWQLLRRYLYSFWEVLFLTAMIWFSLEAGLNVFPGVVLGVYFFMVYHCRDMPAYLLMRDRLATYPRARTRLRYVYMAGFAALLLSIRVTAQLAGLQ